MSARELGLILTELDLTINGVTVPVVEQDVIAFQAEPELREVMRQYLTGVDVIGHVHGTIEVWESGEKIKTVAINWDDVDLDDFWGQFYDVLREAYEEIAA